MFIDVKHIERGWNIALLLLTIHPWKTYRAGVSVWPNGSRKYSRTTRWPEYIQYILYVDWMGPALLYFCSLRPLF